VPPHCATPRLVNRGRFLLIRPPLHIGNRSARVL